MKLKKKYERMCLDALHIEWAGILASSIVEKSPVEASSQEVVELDFSSSEFESKWE